MDNERELALEQRMTQLEKQVEFLIKDHDTLVRMEGNVSQIKSTLETLVTKTEFSPVKLISFGMVSILMSGVLIAIVAMLLKK